MIATFQRRIRPMLGRVLARHIRRKVVRRVGHGTGGPTTDGSITVAGIFKKANGISEGARLQSAAFDALGYQVREIDVSDGIYNPFARVRPAVDTGAIICHADGMQAPIGLNMALGRDSRAARIGYCAWELTVPPLGWQGFDRAFHEIWTPTRFAAEALAPICTVPVRVVRHVVAPPVAIDAAAFRASLGIAPDEVVALAMGDVRSSFARKNPLGAIRAVSAARRQGDRPITLIVKITAAAKRPDLVDMLRAEAEGLRVIFLDRYLDADERWALLAAADIYVSLHRAEGFGLPMLEAMALGKPVVATGWSGNMDFMDAANAALVDHELVDVEDAQGLFSGGKWAEPDLTHAAALIARLAADPDERHRIGAAAAASASHAAQLADFRRQIAATIIGPPPGSTHGATGQVRP